MAFPSTFADLKAAVLNEIKSTSADDGTKVADWINQRYAQACIEVEANQSVATMDLTAGTDTYTLPDGIDRIIDMYVTPVSGTRGGTLIATSIADIIQRQRGTTSADGNYVTHYAVLGINEMAVWPTPQSADTITVYYATLPTELSADDDTPVLHEPYASKLLFHGPASDGHTFKKDWEAAQWHAAQFENWIGRYRTHLNRKKGTTTRQFRIVGQQPYVPHDPSTDLRFGA